MPKIVSKRYQLRGDALLEILQPGRLHTNCTVLASLLWHEDNLGAPKRRSKIEIVYMLQRRIPHADVSNWIDAKRLPLIVANSSSIGS